MYSIMFVDLTWLQSKNSLQAFHDLKSNLEIYVVEN